MSARLPIAISRTSRKACRPSIRLISKPVEDINGSFCNCASIAGVMINTVINCGSMPSRRPGFRENPSTYFDSYGSRVGTTIGAKTRDKELTCTCMSCKILNLAGNTHLFAIRPESKITSLRKAPKDGNTWGSSVLKLLFRRQNGFAKSSPV